MFTNIGDRYWQLKNMVSALFQSRPRGTGGTRSLETNGIEFGWQSIQDLYQREVGRIQAGQVTRVPKLKESFIVRDSWTRLNVMPSKVMQVHICIRVVCCVYIHNYVEWKIYFDFHCK